MKILISAAEASSDHHAAALVRAIREGAKARGLPEPEFLGIGGKALEAEGLRAVVDAREMLSMGLVEILGRIPRILKALDELEAAAKREQPDAAILVDYPEFHFKLAERLKRLAIPAICFIPPKIWVWRKGRMKKIRRLYRHVFSILPFETKMYREAAMPSDYVGNPLLDELPLTMTKSEARAKLGISAQEKVLLVMPGSRPSEIDYHLEPLVRAAAHLAQEFRDDGRGSLRVLMPIADTIELEEVQERIREIHESRGLDLHVTQGDAWVALVAADAGIIKSGTSSLEAALLGCPHAVIYRMHPFSEWVFRQVVRYKKPISLVNLVQGWKKGDRKIVEELIMERFSVEEMVRELRPLLAERSPERTRMLEGFAQVRLALSPPGLNGEGPSRFAARRIFELLEEWEREGGHA